MRDVYRLIEVGSKYMNVKLAYLPEKIFRMSSADEIAPSMMIASEDHMSYQEIPKYHDSSGRTLCFLFGSERFSKLNQTRQPRSRHLRHLES